MVVFPNAKINLGLNIIAKRSDGYHDIESCFYPIGWTDVLEIVESNVLKFISSGIEIPGMESENLCMKAYQTLQKKYSITPVHIHLHKIIPIGAGLGGGSSDAAFTIKALNEIFSLNMTYDEMEDHASQIGSDCPFFIRNTPAIASGQGTQLEPIQIDLSRKWIVIVNPGIHISTREAYAGIRIGSSTPGTIKNGLKDPFYEWKNVLKNDFEESVFKRHHEILLLKESLSNASATYTSMTGSGSTVYGIFESPPTKLDLSESYQTWIGEL